MCVPSDVMVDEWGSRGRSFCIRLLKGSSVTSSTLGDSLPKLKVKDLSKRRN